MESARDPAACEAPLDTAPEESWPGVARSFPAGSAAGMRRRAEPSAPLIDSERSVVLSMTVPSERVLPCSTEAMSAVGPVVPTSDVVLPSRAEPWSEAKLPAEPTRPSADCGPFCTPTIPVGAAVRSPNGPLLASTLTYLTPAGSPDNENRTLPEGRSILLRTSVELPSG